MPVRRRPPAEPPGRDRPAARRGPACALVGAAWAVVVAALGAVAGAVATAPVSGLLPATALLVVAPALAADERRSATKPRPGAKNGASKKSGKSAAPKRSAASDGRSEAEAKAELARVRERIKQITEGVQDDVAKRDSVAAELREADKSVAAARTRLESVRAAREESEKRREGLREEQARTQAALAGERDALAAQLRSAYVAGREEQLKVLLNAGDPATLGRMLQYYGYFGKARAANIASIDERLTHLEAIDQELAAEDAKLAELERQRKKEVGALDAARGRREQALGQLQARIDTRNTELRELRNNAAALEQLVEKLRAAIEEFDAREVTSPTGRGGAFEQARGKLPWPARGTLLAKYGDARPGGLKWNGVLLETAPGAPVRAPYYGRVVYADWLTGLGQLVILDHGGGYISLYANNDRIRTQVGQRVEPGDVLATSSAGGLRPELYFEIRRGSRPVDPRPWLKGEPAAAARGP